MGGNYKTDAFNLRYSYTTVIVSLLESGAGGTTKFLNTETHSNNATACLVMVAVLCDRCIRDKHCAELEKFEVVRVGI